MKGSNMNIVILHVFFFSVQYCPPYPSTDYRDRDPKKMDFNRVYNSKILRNNEYPDWKPDQN